MTAEQIRFMLNGQTKTVDGLPRISDLLADLGLSAEQVAVEINRQVIGRKSYSRRIIHSGDKVEIVTFVGGG